MSDYNYKDLQNQLEVIGSLRKELQAPNKTPSEKKYIQEELDSRISLYNIDKNKYGYEYDGGARKSKRRGKKGKRTRKYRKSKSKSKSKK